MATKTQAAPAERIPPKRPSSPAPSGTPRPRPHSHDPANDPQFSGLPRFEQLPAELPKAGILAVVHRSKLLPHPKNPREIDPYAESELLESLKRSKGLREPPTWNRRNGLLVGGHQRLNQEDRRRGTQDYWVRVVVVDYDEAQHVEEMVAVNNEHLMGTYNIPVLDELIRQEGVSLENMAFNPVSLEGLYNQAGFDLPDSFLPENERSTAEGQRAAGEAADQVVDQLNEADAARQREKEQAKEQRNSIESIKERRNEYQQQAAHEGQTDVCATLVFPTEELKWAFMRYIDRPETAERLDGPAFVRFLELDIPEFESLGSSDAKTNNTPTEGNEAGDVECTRSGVGDDHEPEHDAAQPGEGQAQVGDDPNRRKSSRRNAATRKRDGGNYASGGVLRGDGGVESEKQPELAGSAAAVATVDLFDDL